MNRDNLKRDVLVSIRPEYASQIMNGKKTVELRRKFPVAASTGATILIYSSSPVRAIVGHAQIKQVIKLPLDDLWKIHGSSACIRKEAFDKYFLGLKDGFAILLGSVRTLRRQPKYQELRDQFGFTPPQSFRYIDEDLNSLLFDERTQTADRYKRRNRA